MADNAIQSFLNAHARSDTSSDNNSVVNNNINNRHNHNYSSTTSSSTPHIRPTCCCGLDACAFRQQNQNALEDLERDVRTAAQLGQALLQRHETYVSETGCEREKMIAQIAGLEAEKHNLEVANSVAIDENRHLLDQLEAVNNAVAESDAHVTSLQATLMSTQQELHRLTSLAARTSRLDQQLADLEQERATWHIALNTSEEAAKAAMRRWQQAERSITGLQEQIERVERDGREEQDRHAEIIARMERRHAVETELTSAAGRLKGAAAIRSSTGESGGQSVVSHFVKDILQDNANLQLGIVELREMLQTSNDEVEALRVRLVDHRSDPTRSPTSPSQELTPKQKDLGNELNRAASQELHVHHHYHAPQPVTATPRPPVARKKKKRYPTPSAYSSGYSTPRTSISYGGHSPAATILQHTAVTIPQTQPDNRWSTHSQQAYYSTSGPSSPQSTTNRTSSLYERVFSDAGLDSSRPTTPDSEAPVSPLLLAANVKRLSFGSHRTRSAPLAHRHGTGNASRQYLGATVNVDAGQLLDHDGDFAGSTCIPEEVEADWENATSPGFESMSEAPSSTVVTDLPTPFMDSDIYQPRIRRVQSHESLFSVAGMDVHTLQSRPSQLLTPFAGRSFTSTPVLGDAQGHVLRTADFSRPADSGRDLLSGMAQDLKSVRQRPSLGQKMGGWVFGRWGTTPSPSIQRDDASIASDSISKNSIDTASSSDVQTTPKKIVVRHRLPGINQPGPIMGFLPETRAPVAAPVMNLLDDEALRNALDSGHE